MERIERWSQARQEHVSFGDRDKLCHVSQAEPIAGRWTAARRHLIVVCSEGSSRRRIRSSKAPSGGTQIVVPTQHSLARDEKKPVMWCARNMKGAGPWHGTSAEHGLRSCRVDFPSTCTVASTGCSRMYPIYLIASINHITSPHFTLLGTSVAARWQALRCPRDCSSIMPATCTCTLHTFFSLLPSESQAGVAVNGQLQAI